MQVSGLLRERDGSPRAAHREVRWPVATGLPAPANRGGQRGEASSLGSYGMWTVRLPRVTVYRFVGVKPCTTIESAAVRDGATEKPT